VDQLTDFFAMGGYGAYIWSAYLIAAVVLLVLLIASLRSLRETESRLAVLRQARRVIPEESA
jgi:heme exporter protein D